MRVKLSSAVSVLSAMCVMPPNVQSSATATGGHASNGIMIIKFHVSVKTEGAVAVSCSDLLGFAINRLLAMRNMPASAGTAAKLQKLRCE